MKLPKLSPKVVPFLLVVAAALVLLVVTGDTQYLVALCLSVIASGGAIAIPPAPGVRQDDVEALSAGEAVQIPRSRRR